MPTAIQRAVLLVHGLEADHRGDPGRGDADTGTVADLIAVARVQAQLGAEADDWLLAVYDAALAGLCGALGVGHCLIDENVCPERERQRVELALMARGTTGSS